MGLGWGLQHLEDVVGDDVELLLLLLGEGLGLGLGFRVRVGVTPYPTLRTLLEMTSSFFCSSPWTLIPPWRPVRSEMPARVTRFAMVLQAIWLGVGVTGLGLGLAGLGLKTWDTWELGWGCGWRTAPRLDFVKKSSPRT